MRCSQLGGRHETSPKNRPGIFEHCERIAGVFMRGIRASRPNLSEYFRPPANGGCPETKSPATIGPYGQPARHPPEFGRSPGQLGRSAALAGILRYLLEVNLFDGAQGGPDRCGGA